MEVRNVLITGVSGFIGGALVRALGEEAGIRLFGHSRDIDRARSIYKDERIEFVEKVTAEILNKYDIHAIVHLAGIAHDLSKRYTEDDYYKVNGLATRALYDEFVQSGAGRFIFLSSIKAAIESASYPVDESVNPEPQSPYGRSKLLAEQYLVEHPSPGKDCYILRPCMVHGPGNKGNLNLLYNFVHSGFPFPLGSFSNQRSFLSVDNLTFIVRALIHGNVQSGVYHLADDGFLSTAELYRLIATTIGRKPRVWNIPRPLITGAFSVLGKRSMLTKLAGDMMVSNKKILGQLNSPLPVSLHAGLKKTIRSFNES